MIKLIQISETFGDCTAKYAVEMDHVYTVKHFIDEVLTRNEWGRISIDCYNDPFTDQPNCEYNKDKLISDLPEELMDRIFIEARARGGWSSMDYILVIA